MSRLLIVDDEPTICWGLTRTAEQLGHQAVVASSAEEALDLAAEQHFDAMVLDVRLPGLDGLSAARELRKVHAPVPVIVITAYGDLDTAVEAIRSGAFEYLIKPFDLATAERVIQRALKLDTATPQTARDEVSPQQELVGSSAAMQQVFKQLALAAASDSSVQIRGESGTGKELVARAVHRFSARAAGPFVPVNLASLSESVAESELFGHVRGAFTGAEQARAGLIEQANGGTLFLDEVADIPLSLQVKLLRALEQGEVLPVGGNQPRLSDFRVISATHRDLAQLLAEGRFRHDLYYRLGTFEISLPPLRERLDDVAALAEHFLDRLARKSSQPRARLTDEALAALRDRAWPGNVRELRNAIEHAVVVSRGGTIGPEHFPAPTAAVAGEASTAEVVSSAVRNWAAEQYAAGANPEQLYDRLLQVVEPPLLDVALARHDGQVAAAARALGLHRMTVRKKLEQFKTESEDHEPPPAAGE